MRRLSILLALALVIAACTEDAAPTTTTSSLVSTTTTLSTTTTVPPPTTTVPPSTTTTTWPWPDAEPLDLGPLEPRAGHSVVWTGTEMIVWGGLGDEMGASGRFNNGAAFDPETNTWRLIAESPLSPRWYHFAVWTGEEMLVIGGGTTEGAAYNPTTDSWREMARAPFDVAGEQWPYMPAVWDGDATVVWAPWLNRIATYSPELDRWDELEPPPVTGQLGKLFIEDDSLFAFASGRAPIPLDGAYLRGNEWTVLPSVDLSTSEYNVAAPPGLALWVGDRVLAFSDSGSDGLMATLVPGDSTWNEMESSALNGCEFVAPPLGIGDDWYAPICGTSWILDSETLAFGTMELPGLVDTRYAVWTGEEVLVWGNPCCFGTGGRPFEVEAWRFSP